MKVLLVEDSLADARLVREILHEVDPAGFDLVHSQDLGLALQVLGCEKVDAVLLDLGLPDAHGLEALAPIRQADPDIPIVVLSAHADESLAMQAVQAGAQDFLLKGRGDGTLLARALRYAVERKRAELRIRHLAHYDALTDLPNRRLLIDRLGQALARTRRERKLLALLFLDLDRFKIVNDTLGHAAGDELLQSVAARLLGCMRECDTVARLSGDEFTLVLPEVTNLEDASRFAAKVLQALRAPFHIAGREEHITASIGIGIYPNDADSVEALLRCADAAMYQAKRQGRNRYQFHTDTRDIRFSERLILARDLHHTLKGEHLKLHYQPRIDVRSHQIVGAEALLRWDHPSLGLLSAARFVPLAEELGMIGPMGEWALRQACAQGRAWNDVASAPLSISVNVSSHEFNHRNLVHNVERALHDSPMGAGHLELELTEAGVMRDERAAASTLRELSTLGVKISVDDFGTGHSSLSRLKRFPIDALKIDRSFVQDVLSDDNDAAIITAIIAMGHGMKLRVVAEGVEVAEQAEFLSHQGCDEMQGFYFGPPVPAETLTPLLNGNGRSVDTAA